jgi:hypothetical protein
MRADVGAYVATTKTDLTLAALQTFFADPAVRDSPSRKPRECAAINFTLRAWRSCSRSNR